MKHVNPPYLCGRAVMLRLAVTLGLVLMLSLAVSHLGGPEKRLPVGVERSIAR